MIIWDVTVFYGVVDTSRSSDHVSCLKTLNLTVVVLWKIKFVYYILKQLYRVFHMDYSQKVNEYCVVIVLIQKKIPSTILLLYIVLEFLFSFKFFKGFHLITSPLYDLMISEVANFSNVVTRLLWV